MQVENKSEKQFKVLRVVGKSKFRVYEVADVKESNSHYAMKVFPWNNSSPCDQYMTEKRYNKLNHENIIKIIDSKDRQVTQTKASEKTDTSSYILYELSPYGDFNSIVQDSEEFEFSDMMTRTYFRQLISGLEYLHSNGVAHLDIKPENLLLGKDFKLKIADFDQSYMSGDQRLRGRGTPHYRPHELKSYKSAEADELTLEPIDVFSAGVVLFTLRFGLLPFLEGERVEGQDLYELLMKNPEAFWAFHKKNSPNVEPSESFKALFKNMVEVDPVERLNIEEIKRSKWFQEDKVYEPQELEKKMAALYY